jgi:hypothetical protein
VKRSGFGLSVGFPGLLVTDIVVMLNAVPTLVHIYVGDDLTVLGAGNELQWLSAAFAHGVVAGFYEAEDGAAHR